MRIIFLIFCTFFLIAHLCQAEKSAAMKVIAKSFPEMTFETLSGQEVYFPTHQAALLVIGFEKESVHTAKGWLQAIKQEKLLPKNIFLYTIAAIGDSFKAKLVRPFVIKGLKKQIPAQHQSRILLATEAMQHLIQFLGILTPSNEVTLLLIDKHGIVRWQHTGVISTESQHNLKKISTLLQS